MTKSCKAAVFKKCAEERTSPKDNKMKTWAAEASETGSLICTGSGGLSLEKGLSVAGGGRTHTHTGDVSNQELGWEEWKPDYKELGIHNEEVKEVNSDHVFKIKFDFKRREIRHLFDRNVRSRKKWTCPPSPLFVISEGIYNVFGWKVAVKIETGERSTCIRPSHPFPLLFH